MPAKKAKKETKKKTAKKTTPKRKKNGQFCKK